MKNQFFSRQAIMVAMFVLSSSIAASCSAHPDNSRNREGFITNKDSVMRKAVGDSIYTIISQAKKIKVEILRLEADTVFPSDGFQIKSKYIPLVKFVLSDPKIYNGSAPAYGSFMPSFSLTFSKRRERCMAKFDFGLKKWAICDNKGKELKAFDLSSDDMLRVADLFFPDNKYFQSLINAETK